MALEVTSTFICSEPDGGLGPDSDHRSVSLLFFSQAHSWHRAIVVSKLSFKLTCHISSQSYQLLALSLFGGNIDILLRTSSLNLLLLLNVLSLTEVRTIFIIYIMYILFCTCVVFI